MFINRLINLCHTDYLRLIGIVFIFGLRASSFTFGLHSVKYYIAAKLGLRIICISDSALCLVALARGRLV